MPAFCIKLGIEALHDTIYHTPQIAGRCRRLQTRQKELSFRTDRVVCALDALKLPSEFPQGVAPLRERRKPLATVEIASTAHQ